MYYSFFFFCLFSHNSLMLNILILLTHNEINQISIIVIFESISYAINRILWDFNIDNYIGFQNIRFL